MADGETKDEAVRAWWAMWRREDYSWDGLAQRPWPGWSITPGGALVERANAPEGAPDATLQDYWRGEEGRLIEGDGKRWTYAHCPLTWADGTRTPKADWSPEERLQAQIAIARMLEGKGRAHFQGCVFVGFQGPPRPLTCDADFTGACFAGAINCTAISFVEGTNLRNTLFLGPASFQQASFEGVVDFANAVFCVDVTFGHAVFSRASSFYGAAFHGSARFVSANFDAASNFEGAHFAHEADFRAAAFAGDARFRRAEFSILGVFESVTFADAAHFAQATFAGGVFVRATFAKEGEFRAAEFSDDANFSEATFSREMNFELARFHRASFRRAIGVGMINFAQAAFSGAFAASACEFRGFANFDRASFGASVDFAAATFDKLASFRDTTWPTSGADWHGAFNQALFRGTAVFVGAGFARLASFDGATFERGLQLDDPSEQLASAVFVRERKGAAALDEHDARAWAESEMARRRKASGERAEPVSAADIAEVKRRARETRLKQLERGCRVLKQAMELASNKTREQMLYRFELLARRAQRDTPLWEKAFSHLYGWASDYGASMARPFVALALVIVAFGAAYWIAALALTVAMPQSVALYDIGARRPEDLWHALTFSWNNSFRPLSALSSEVVGPRDPSWAAQLLYGYPPGYGFAVRAVATLQSLLAIVLAFLFALAVRRRFQIS